MCLIFVVLKALEKTNRNLHRAFSLVSKVPGTPLHGSVLLSVSVFTCVYLVNQEKLLIHGETRLLC